MMQKKGMFWTVFRVSVNDIFIRYFYVDGIIHFFPDLRQCLGQSFSLRDRTGVFGASVSFTGTSLIIIVGVVIETLKQLESQLLVPKTKYYTICSGHTL